MLLSSVILLSSVLEQMESFGRETQPGKGERAYAIHVPIEGNIQGSSSLRMLSEATGDAKWIGTSGFRRIEFSHSLIILSAVFLRVQRRGRDIRAGLVALPGSISVRSPLTSELVCAPVALRFFARFHARFPSSFFIFLHPSHPCCCCCSHHCLPFPFRRRLFATGEKAL